LWGLPTHNNAKTIGAGRAIPSRPESCAGFPGTGPSSSIPMADLRDGTRELVTGISIDDLRPVSNLHALRTLHCISTPYGSSPSSAVALRTILAAAELLRAKACIVMSPESSHTEDAWISKLLQPIRTDGFDLVTPTYRRHKFDGLLITNLLYPMIRALYGLRIREPIPMSSGFPGRFGAEFLLNNVWDDGTGASGPELSLTLAAITGRQRICQSFLGQKDHIERRSADLVPATQRNSWPHVLRPGFDFSSVGCGDRFASHSHYRSDHEVLLDPVRVNRKRLREMFSTGVS